LSFFYWSYREENFLDEVDRRKYGGDDRSYHKPDVICTPKEHYATHLPVWRRVPSKFDISIAGRQFSIPEAYRPRKNGDAVFIDAVSPDFASYDPKQRLANKSWPQNWHDVAISDASSTNLSSELEGIVSRYPATEKVGPEFDLTRIQLYYDDRNQRQSGGLLYTAYDDAGQLIRFIHCRPATVKLPCRFTFLDAGLAFNLSIEDVSEWQKI
jgi:hypothetical protein